jgi:hypothetical protein
LEVIPHISLDDSNRLKVLKIIGKEKSLFITFRLYETYEYPELGKSKNIVWNLKTASKLENVEGISAYCILIPDRIIEYVPLSRE